MAVDEELRALDALADAPAEERATALLHAFLWGNRADLGFRVTEGESASGDAAGGLVADDSAVLWQLLNTTGQSMLYCAHAVDVANGEWAHDFGCGYWTSAQSGESGTGVQGGPGFSGSWDVPAGTYVVSTGVWVNGRYYGDVQSPRTNIGGALSAGDAAQSDTRPRVLPRPGAGARSRW